MRYFKNLTFILGTIFLVSHAALATQYYCTVKVTEYDYSTGKYDTNQTIEQQCSVFNNSRDRNIYYSCLRDTKLYQKAANAGKCSQIIRKTKYISGSKCEIDLVPDKNIHLGYSCQGGNVREAGRAIDRMYSNK